MSNLGLEQALERDGIRMLRTPVGDKYVLEEMVRRGAVLGGEQSGHVIFREYATTGDGMLTALRVFEIARRRAKALDELTADLEVYPQRLVNVRVTRAEPLDELPAVDARSPPAKREFDGSGRVLVRFSGTEPLARVMVEGPDLAQVEAFTAASRMNPRAKSDENFNYAQTSEFSCALSPPPGLPAQPSQQTEQLRPNSPTNNGCRCSTAKISPAGSQVGNEKWNVEDGTIHGQAVTKGYGYLQTEKNYKDFHLSLRFKCEGDGNSGVFFHAEFKPGTADVMQGPQFEIDPHAQPSHRRHLR